MISDDLFHLISCLSNRSLTLTNIMDVSGISQDLNLFDEETATPSDKNQLSDKDEDVLKVSESLRVEMEDLCSRLHELKLDYIR